MGACPACKKRGVLRSRRAVAREGTTMILNGPGISYTEPDIGAEFVPPLPEHPREAIVKLCEHCTNRLLHRDVIILRILILVLILIFHKFYLPL